MKKLLLVLSSLSIFITAPLTVIACRTTPNTEPTEIYDYIQWRNQLVNEVTEIINTNLNSQLRSYLFISKNDPRFENFESLNFNKIMELLENSDSKAINRNHELFSSFNREIISLVNWAQITQIVANQVIGNINYRPLFFENRNPLQGLLEVNQINLTKQGRNEVATISLDFSSSIFIKDPNDNLHIHPVNTPTRISFFSNEAEQANVLKVIENINSELIKPEVANNFSFVSSSGSVRRNIINLRNTSVRDDFKTFINKTINENSFDLKDLNIPSNVNLNFRTAEQSVINASNGSWRVNSTWYDPQPGDATLLKDALLNGGNDLNNVIQETVKVTDQMSIFGINRSNVSSEILDQLTENDFWWFNHLFLRNTVINNNNPIFSGILRSSGSNFEISQDSSVDGRAIAVYPVAISNLSLSYQSISQDIITFELPQMSIFVKQLTRESGTKELIKKWLEANLEMYREMFGFISKTNNGEDNLAIRIPDEFKNVFEFDRLFDTPAFMQALAIDTANRMLTRREDINPELISGFSIDVLSTFNARIKFSRQNSNMYFMLPTSDIVLFNQNLGLRFNFFSDQQFNYSPFWGAPNLRLNIGGQRVITRPQYGIDTSGIIFTDFN